MPRITPVQREQAIGRGHKWLLVHLIATFEQFNAYKDFTMRQTARQTIHVVVT
jgi:hypothetical protein